MPLTDQINLLCSEGSFIVNIRYYGYKINLYLLGSNYIEAFYNHKENRIEKIQLMDDNSKRINFYADQIRLPKGI